MPESTVQEFAEDDASYQAWLRRHPAGYIINTPRSKPANYMVLHRASCSTIGDYNKMARPGGFTEREYIKICATDLAGLRAWVRQHGRPDGSFSSICSLCKPSA